MGDNEIGDDKNDGKSLAISIAMAMQRPIEHVQGFTGSHWMPLSGECLRCIAPAAVMVNEFVFKTQNTNKTQLLPSNYKHFER